MQDMLPSSENGLESRGFVLAVDKGVDDAPPSHRAQNRTKFDARPKVTGSSPKPKGSSSDALEGPGSSP